MRRPAMLALCLSLVLGAGACVPLVPVSEQDAAPEFDEEVASVAEVQAALTNLGFRPGPIDGQEGSRTARAVRAYRESRGLPRNGGIDGALSTSLRAEAESAPGVPAPDPRLVERRWLPGRIREALDPEWPDYLAMMIDLDRDGDLDLVAEAHADTGLCDGDLCPWAIFEDSPSGWRKAGAFEARGVKLRRGRHNGWRDLSALLDNGAAIMRYDGAFYR